MPISCQTAQRVGGGQSFKVTAIDSRPKHQILNGYIGATAARFYYRHRGLI